MNRDLRYERRADVYVVRTRMVIGPANEGRLHDMRRAFGDLELAKFLDLNPSIPRELAFVDDSKTFDAYEAAGFGKIGEVTPTDINIQPPGFSPGQWFQYLMNVMALSPVRKVGPGGFYTIHESSEAY